MKKTTKTKVKHCIADAKNLMTKSMDTNGMSLNEILSSIDSHQSNDEMEDGPDFPSFVPIHTLQKIKETLGKKEIKVDDSGQEILVPVYAEEEKAKVIFGLLAERGINLLDHLEDCLGKVGYDVDMVDSINASVGRVGEMLRDICDLQYKKSKLENERTNLEIQKYKADLKKRELDIKEKAVEKGPSNTNVIAVGNAHELLKMMQSNKTLNDEIQEVDLIEGGEDGQEE